MEQRNENKTELKMIKMSDVQSQTVDWLVSPKMLSLIEKPLNTRDSGLEI